MALVWRGQNERLAPFTVRPFFSFLTLCNTYTIPAAKAIRLNEMNEIGAP